MPLAFKIHSSWGPTVYGLVRGEPAAQKLVRSARAHLKKLGGGKVFSVQPQNRGAQITAPIP